MYCRYCGKDIGDSVFCPNCQQQMGYDILLRDATHDSERARINDVPNIFVIVLAFFIPIFGYIYYLSNISRYQVKSRAYAISALCGTFTSFALIVISTIISAL